MWPIADRALPLVALGLTCICLPAIAQPEELPVPSECLVLPLPFRGRGLPVPADPIAHALAEGTWRAPKAGDAFTLPDGSSATWETCAADAEGWFEHRALRGGYAYMPIESATERVALLEAQGHGMAILNGEQHAGDVYSYGWLRAPVLLHVGRNDLLLAGGRGRLRVRLLVPESSVCLDPRETTLPDLVTGEAADTLGGVVLENATGETARGLRLIARVGEGEETETELPPMPPLSVRKMGFHIRTAAIAEPGTAPLGLRLLDAKGTELGAARVDLRVRRPRETRKITFESEIDGSVQYYGLNPASADGAGALVLTCHGAAVEAIGQADAYSPKSWANLVAPTNRRPYGFDWEDWGRLDAMEVLDQATRLLKPDPSRIYLTGHSMGGHGAWHLGVTYPERFAATGPSAGWVSLWSRGRVGSEPAAGSVQELIRRAASPSNTEGLAHNLLNEGVYVLHGEADDNVPVAEARAMRDVLTTFHRDWEYHEEPGAGHWWDNSEEPGAACVDYPAMFQFFSRHRIPSHAEVRDVEFTTMSPTVSATCYWAAVEMQQKQFVTSAIHLHWDPLLAKLSGTTENVRRLRVSLPNLAEGATVKVALDGSDLSVETDPNYGGAFWLARSEQGWEMTAPAASTSKGPERAGPFRNAFTNRVVLVYGTHGTPEENTWALSRARYDSETFYYRGNGSMDTIPDDELDLDTYRDRNVVLYGNRSTNSAWAKVLRDDEPITLDEGIARVGEREIAGADTGCLLVRPRVDSHVALVGVIGGTGLRGMRATDRAVYFQSGASIPDFVVFDGTVTLKGTDGVLCAGFFGENWDLETAEVAWR